MQHARDLTAPPCVTSHTPPQSSTYHRSESASSAQYAILRRDAHDENAYDRQQRLLGSFRSSGSQTVNHADDARMSGSYFNTSQEIFDGSGGTLRSAPTTTTRTTFERHDSGEVSSSDGGGGIMGYKSSASQSESYGRGDGGEPSSGDDGGATFEGHSSQSAAFGYASSSSRPPSGFERAASLTEPFADLPSSTQRRGLYGMSLEHLKRLRNEWQAGLLRSVSALSDSLLATPLDIERRVEDSHRRDHSRTWSGMQQREEHQETGFQDSTPGLANRIAFPHSGEIVPDNTSDFSNGRDLRAMGRDPGNGVEPSPHSTRLEPPSRTTNDSFASLLLEKEIEYSHRAGFDVQPPRRGECRRSVGKLDRTSHKARTTAQAKSSSQSRDPESGTTFADQGQDVRLTPWNGDSRGGRGTSEMEESSAGNSTPFSAAAPQAAPTSSREKIPGLRYRASDEVEEKLPRTRLRSWRRSSSGDSLWMGEPSDPSWTSNALPEEIPSRGETLGFNCSAWERSTLRSVNKLSQGSANPSGERPPSHASQIITVFQAASPSRGENSVVNHSARERYTFDSMSKRLRTTRPLETPLEERSPSDASGIITGMEAAGFSRDRVSAFKRRASEEFTWNPPNKRAKGKGKAKALESDMDLPFNGSQPPPASPTEEVLGSVRRALEDSTFKPRSQRPKGKGNAKVFESDVDLPFNDSQQSLDSRTERLSGSEQSVSEESGAKMPPPPTTTKRRAKGKGKRKIPAEWPRCRNCKNCVDAKRRGIA